MAENETKRETMQQFNMKLYPADVERFNAIADSMENVNTKGQAFAALMDFWENPKTVIKDNPAHLQRIAELEAEAGKRTNEITDLRAKLGKAQAEANDNGQTSAALQLRIDELEAEAEKKSNEMTGLRARLEKAQGEANDNGYASAALQLRIDGLEAENAALREQKNVPENVITLEVHPVPWYFLKKMSESETKRTGKTVEPGKILTELFIRDLQNPRSNNLPYIVSSSEIADVKTKYEAAMKKKAEAGQKEAGQEPAGQEAGNGD